MDLLEGGAKRFASGVRDLLDFGETSHSGPNKSFCSMWDLDIVSGVFGIIEYITMVQSRRHEMF